MGLEVPRRKGCEQLLLLEDVLSGLLLLLIVATVDLLLIVTGLLLTIVSVLANAYSGFPIVQANASHAKSESCTLCSFLRLNRQN